MSADVEHLRGRLGSLGFDVVRFTSIGEQAPGGAAFSAWLRAGHQADMAWLTRSEPKRLEPAQVLAGARSMVLLGVNYGPGRSSEERPIWARYALHRDYHDTLKPALAAAGRELEAWAGIGPEDYRYYVDTGPVLERNWAAQAGMGFTGKNAMLISREFGNWLFLAALLVRQELPPDAPISRRSESHPVGTLCGRCTACLDACPTGALPQPGVLDARRCISYHTIENKGMIPRALRPRIGSRIYGCDICAEVCPWNRFAQMARSGLIEAQPAIGELSLEAILTLTAESFARIFKGTPIKRLKLRGLLRNACIVAANEQRSDLLPRLLALAEQSPEPLVRAHAVWAVRVLGGEAVVSPAMRIDPDPWVQAELAASREEEK